MRNGLCLILLAAAPAAVAQTPDSLAPPVELTAEEDHRRVMALLGVESLRPGPSGNPEAPNAANTDESLASPYARLPDPLLTDGGRPVTTAVQWWHGRRSEIVEHFDRELYGRMPDDVPEVHWETVGVERDTVAGIPVVTKTLAGHVDNTAYPLIDVTIDLFGKSPVVLRSARIAESRGGGAIDAATDQPLVFDGRSGVTIDPGQSATSDPIDFALEPLSDVAITIHFGQLDADIITGHPGSRTTSYLVEGDMSVVPTLPGAVQTDHWYIISGLDVERSGSAVATLGDSITDGRGSGTNEQNRWPDELARRLQSDPRTEDVAVLNMGIGGNCAGAPRQHRRHRPTGNASSRDAPNAGTAYSLSLR